MCAQESRTSTESNKTALTLKDGYQAVVDYTSKTSDIARALGLAGIAIIWVFKTGAGTTQTVPFELLPAGLLLIVGLSLDLFQYVVSAAIWYFFTRKKEKAGVTEFVAPGWINWPGFSLFVAKVIAIVIAYIYLFAYLALKVF